MEAKRAAEDHPQRWEGLAELAQGIQKPNGIVGLPDFNQFVEENGNLPKIKSASWSRRVARAACRYPQERRTTIRIRGSLCLDAALAFSELPAETSRRFWFANRHRRASQCVTVRLVAIPIQEQSPRFVRRKIRERPNPASLRRPALKAKSFPYAVQTGANATPFQDSPHIHDKCFPAYNLLSCCIYSWRSKSRFHGLISHRTSLLSYDYYIVRLYIK